jgi:hypothetical protein
LTSNEEVKPTTGPLDVLDSCPDCGKRQFGVEERCGDIVFRCRGCRAGWRYSLGYIHRVSDRAVATS